MGPIRSESRYLWKCLSSSIICIRTSRFRTIIPPGFIANSDCECHCWWFMSIYESGAFRILPWLSLSKSWYANGCNVCLKHTLLCLTDRFSQWNFGVLQRFSDRREVSVCLVPCTTWCTGTAVTPLSCVNHVWWFHHSLCWQWKQFCFTPRCFATWKWRIFRLLHFSVPGAQTSDAAHQNAQQAAHPAHLYNDGSCHYPQHRVTRFPSYSIIMGFYESDLQRCLCVQDLLQILSLSSQKPVVRGRILVGLDFGHSFGHVKTYRVSSCILIVLSPCSSGSRCSLQKTFVNFKITNILTCWRSAFGRRKAASDYPENIKARRDPHDIGDGLERY